MLAELFGWKPKGDKGRYLKDNAKRGAYVSADGRTRYYFTGLTIRRIDPKPRGKSAVRMAKKARRLARERALLLAVTS